jgi:hypothetical protein
MILIQQGTRCAVPELTWGPKWWQVYINNWEWPINITNGRIVDRGKEPTSSQETKHGGNWSRQGTPHNLGGTPRRRAAQNSRWSEDEIIKIETQTRALRPRKTSSPLTLGRRNGESQMYPPTAALLRLLRLRCPNQLLLLCKMHHSSNNHSIPWHQQHLKPQGQGNREVRSWNCIVPWVSMDEVVRVIIDTVVPPPPPPSRSRRHPCFSSQEVGPMALWYETTLRPSLHSLFWWDMLHPI